jgi:tetratricopeptide (TPR) repeat protein
VNQFKTVVMTMILGLFLWPLISWSQLERPLKDTEVQALIANIQQDPENLKSRLFLGTHYYNLNDWQKVIDSLSPVSEKLPDKSLYQLSHSFMNIGDFRQSESIANILLSRDKISTSDYLLATKIKSKILERVKDKVLKEQISKNLFETIKTAQKQDPKNLEIYDVWLEMLELHITHYPQEALRVLEDMKKNSLIFRPKHYSMICKYNYMAGLTKATKLSCNQAIVSDPDNPSNYIYLGQTHVNVGEDKVGKRMLASVGKKFSESEEALWATAESYFQSGNIAKAYQFFKKASLHSDAKPRDYMGLARTAFELKKFNEALLAFINHCRQENYVHQEFRRASGLLKNQPRWQELYKKRMLDCKPGTLNK